MGWNLLNAWYGEMLRQKDGGRATPESWAHRDEDPFWRAQDQKRARERGYR